MTTIETKITNNGHLILKVDGKRQSYDDVMMRLRYARNSGINIITDRGQSFTGSYNQDRYIFEDDSTGNWLQFDCKEEAVNRLSSGNFREENFIRKFADQDEINKKLQAEIETLDEQRHDHEVEIWHIGNIIKTLQQSRKYCQELTFGFDRDFYNTRFDSLDDNIKILTERKSALLEQCDKLFEQINQLQAQMIVIDF